MEAARGRGVGAVVDVLTVDVQGAAPFAVVIAVASRFSMKKAAATR